MAVSYRNIFVVSAADGHGGKIYFRSGDGAKYAVKCSIKNFLRIFKNFSELQHQNQTGYLIPGNIRNCWNKNITNCWNEQIKNDMNKKPPEKEPFFENLTEKEKQKILQNPKCIYGTTLLTAGLYVDNQTTVLILSQIGDGNIVVIKDDNSLHRPFVKDEYAVGNETLSLCLEGAKDMFKTRVEFLDKPPVAVFLSTDGYFNSFENEEDFEKAVYDFVEIIKTKGVDYLKSRQGQQDQKSQLENILEKTSEIGSGDDISVGILIREDILKAEEK